MKTTFFAWMIMMLFFLGAGCSSGDDDPGALVDNFIPDISRGWKDVNSETRYFFIPDSTNVPIGTFTGSRQNPDSAEVPQLKGSFVHEKVQFTFISGNPTGLSYKGIIDTLHPTVMRLANTEDLLHDSLILNQE